jgi:DNA polymerase-3 subunit chi
MNAVFYVLKHINEPVIANPAHFDLAVKLAANCFRQGKKVFILVDNKQDAHRIDECLWQLEADGFVPHNLQGEGPAMGSAVEIGESAPVANRKVIINLAHFVPDFIRRFSEVYDFVPADEKLKKVARGRYKVMRQLGAHMSIEEIEIKY